MQLSDVNLTDPDIFQEAVPHHMFELLRREAPVYWHPEQSGGFWAITKYVDLKVISKTPALFSSERQGTLLRDVPPHSLPFVQQIMLNMDPPRHRQYRALVNKAFSPRMINNLHARIREMVTRIIDTVIEKGECDFVDDIAAQLPLEVICEMMGVPEEDRRQVYTIGNRMVGFDDPDLQPDGKAMADNADGEAAAAEMFMYAGKLLEKAHTHPADDLATALVNAEIDGARLTDNDFNFFFLLLIIAGNETTRTVTSNGMLDLSRHPDQRRDLRADPSLLPAAVEEILRYNPPVHSCRRTATAHTELRGQRIRENDKVILWYPSANRDEEVFHEPQVFNIRRSPNEHLAFGVGEHFCLGANLARMELNEIFRGVLARVHDIELAAPARRLRSTFINGVKEMRIRFTPGPTAG